MFEPVILKQENTGTTTELDGDAIRDYTVKAGMKYGTDIKFCWWHSHHTMGAFWSGTDQNEIKAWENDSWSLALVVNLYQEYKLNVAVWNPIKHTEDVPLEIIRNMPKPTAKQVKDYEELCDKPVPIVTTNHNWTNNYKQINQVGLWNKVSKDKPLVDDTILEWKNGDNLMEYAELYNNLVDEIEDMLGDYATGTKKYKDYVEFVTATNACLKSRNAKMKVKKVAKGKLLELTATTFPADHITFEDDQADKVYTSATSALEGWQYGY